jgi:hypothetical protein
MKLILMCLQINCLLQYLQYFISFIWFISQIETKALDKGRTDN